MISAAGGTLGILLGWGITLAFSRLAGWAVSVSPQAVALAVFFPAAIGILFGIYPARKASLQNHIDALRYE